MQFYTQAGSVAHILHVIILQRSYRKQKLHRRKAPNQEISHVLCRRDSLWRHSPLLIPLTPRDDGTPVLRYLPRGVSCHDAGRKTQEKTIECSEYDVGTRRHLQIVTREDVSNA